MNKFTYDAVIREQLQFIEEGDHLSPEMNEWLLQYLSQIPGESRWISESEHLPIFQ